MEAVQKNSRIVSLSVVLQLAAYILGRNFSVKAIVLYTESDNCVHNLASPAHHQLHTPPEQECTLSVKYLIYQLIRNHCWYD